jgi:NTE family protein
MHTGVLQAMDEQQLSPAYLAGCSSGAMVGALYAAGHSPRKILEITQQLSIIKIIRIAWSRQGLLSLAPLGRELSKHLPTTFEDLNLPLTVNATDLAGRELLYISQGPLINALLASACLPAVFKPITIDGRTLFDGGIIDNLPVQALPTEGVQRWAANTNYYKDEGKPMSHLGIVIERALRLTIDQNTVPAVNTCRVIITPSEMGHFRVFDMHKAKAIYEVGYRATLEQIALL